MKPLKHFLWNGNLLTTTKDLFGQGLFSSCPPSVFVVPQGLGKNSTWASSSTRLHQPYHLVVGCLGSNGHTESLRMYGASYLINPIRPYEASKPQNHRRTAIPAVLMISPFRTGEMPALPFSHIVKNELGLTFVKYISKVRIDKAKVLLREKELPISQIALEVGFHDSSYFAKVFKKIEKYIPRTFRQNVFKTPAFKKDVPLRILERLRNSTPLRYSNPGAFYGVLLFE